MVNAAGGDALAGEEVPEPLRHERILAELEGLPEAHLRLVLERLAADDEDFEFVEIREHGQGQALVPGVTLGLEDGLRVEFLGRFLGLAYEAVSGVGAEQVVGAFLASTNLGAAFGLDLAMLRDEAGLVLNIPAEGAEEGIEEFLAEIGLVVSSTLVGGEVSAKNFDEPVKFLFK